jgi:hypothetical protein
LGQKENLSTLNLSATIRNFEIFGDEEDYVLYFQTLNFGSLMGKYSEYLEGAI